METRIRVIERWALPALTVLIIAACDSYATDPEVGIRFTTNRSAYVVGESATLTLYNGYRYPVLVSAHWCGREADRWDVEQDQWVLAWTTRTFPCVSPLETVDPGNAVTSDFGWFVAEMAPGRYRFRYTAEDTRAWQQPEVPGDILLVSNTFEIQTPDEAEGR